MRGLLWESDPKLLEDMAAKGETFYGRFPPKKQVAA